MDSRHMRYFLALAETLHFGRAAARMNMSQPPFSRQISGIEETLGVKLFERNSRNVALTPAGKHFLIDCQTVLTQFENACRDVRLVANGMKGELRLGFMMHAAHRVVPRLVRIFSEQRPEVRLILDERTPSDIGQMLVDGTLDAAVTFADSPTPHLQMVPLATDRLRLIIPTGHPLEAAEEVQASHLNGERLIAAPTDVAPTLRWAIGTYCAAAGVVPQYAFEPRLQHTILRLVAEGLGVALVPEQLCADLSEGIVSKPLAGSPQFEIVLCAPVGAKNPATAALLDIARTNRAALT